MVFSSPIFLFAFLPAVYLIYQLLPGIRSRYPVYIFRGRS